MMKRIAITTATLFAGLAAFAIGASQEWVNKRIGESRCVTSTSNDVTVISCDGFKIVQYAYIHKAQVVCNATAAAVANNVTNGTILAYCASNHTYAAKYATVNVGTNAFYYLGQTSVFTNGYIRFEGQFDLIKTWITEPAAAKILKEAN